MENTGYMQIKTLRRKKLHKWTLGKDIARN